jgi:hypothetical protein
MFDRVEELSVFHCCRHACRAALIICGSCEYRQSASRPHLECTIIEKHALGVEELSPGLYGARVACDEGGYAICLAVLVSGPRLDISAVRRAVNRGSSIIELIVSALIQVRSLVVYRERSSDGGK